MKKARPDRYAQKRAEFVAHGLREHIFAKPFLQRLRIALIFLFKGRV